VFPSRPRGPSSTWGRRLLVLALVAVPGSAPAAAGELFGGRVRLGGEASGTIAPEDEGYFNYGDYETNTLRLARLDLLADVRLGRGLSLLGDVRVENFESIRVYALYLRVRPWAAREIDLQAGLVPPVFGAYPRRRYASENPLPSVPLAYQYLNTLRDDAVPSRTEDLVAQRGRGWLVRYPVGSTESAPGLPIVNGERWDTGVELRVAGGPLALAVAVTQGSLCRPRVEDDNDGKQLSGRLAWSPGPGLVLGVSGASGEFLGREVQEGFADRARGTWRQDAAAVDVEWSGGRWIARAEGVWARWRLPALDPTVIAEPVDALSGYVEARYKIRPGLYAAARLERLSFERVPSTLGEATWDAPVTRVEAGLGWSPWRRSTLKLAWQHNERDGGRVRRSDLVAGQVVVWF
jgi:hypothetical protein